MDNLTSNEAIVAGGILGAGLATIAIFFIVFYILVVIADWKIFTKAGEAGWKSLIPIYNVYVLFKIIGMSFWLWIGGVFVASIFDVIISKILGNQDVNSLVTSIYLLVFDVYFAIKLAKAFGKGTGFTIGLIIFPNIFQIILGFDSSKYIGTKN